MQARTGATNTICFPHFLAAYAPLIHIQNVRLFARQVKSFQTFLTPRKRAATADDSSRAIAHCFANTAYAQLLAEHATHPTTPPPRISTSFHPLLTHPPTAALALTHPPCINAREQPLHRRLVPIPATTAPDWDFVSNHAVK